mmetsp:Transcript_32401/g.75725  ORF Transcript_32401/g.75725 Transcript_32401/m.75725 type:complete len:391 (-) Transcript_32401:8-1180(-)
MPYPLQGAPSPPRRGQRATTTATKKYRTEPACPASTPPHSPASKSRSISQAPPARRGRTPTPSPSPTPLSQTVCLQPNSHPRLSPKKATGQVAHPLPLARRAPRSPSGCAQPRVPTAEPAGSGRRVGWGWGDTTASLDRRHTILQLLRSKLVQHRGVPLHLGALTPEHPLEQRRHLLAHAGCLDRRRLEGRYAAERGGPRARLLVKLVLFLFLLVLALWLGECVGVLFLLHRALECPAVTLKLCHYLQQILAARPRPKDRGSTAYTLELPRLPPDLHFAKFLWAHRPPNVPRVLLRQAVGLLQSLLVLDLVAVQGRGEWSLVHVVEALGCLMSSRPLSLPLRAASPYQWGGLLRSPLVAVGGGGMRRCSRVVVHRHQATRGGHTGDKTTD